MDCSLPKVVTKVHIDILAPRVAEVFAVLMSGIQSLRFASFKEMRWLRLGVISPLLVWLVFTRYPGETRKWREAQAWGRTQAAET